MSYLLAGVFYVLFQMGLGFPAPFVPQAATGTWTIVQHPYHFCTSSASCSITVTSTTSGNVGILVGNAYNNNSTLPTFSSITQAGWTHCASGNGSIALSGTEYLYNDCATIMSLSAGVTSFTWNWSSTAYAHVLEFVEAHWSGSTKSVDSSNHGSDSACTTCAGVSLTVTGTDLLVQYGMPADGLPSITSPYTGFFDSSPDTGSSVAGALNRTTGAAPNWTQGVSGVVAVGGVAIKGT